MPTFIFSYHYFFELNGFHLFLVKSQTNFMGKSKTLWFCGNAPNSSFTAFKSNLKYVNNRLMLFTVWSLFHYPLEFRVINDYDIINQSQAQIYRKTALLPAFFWCSDHMFPMRRRRDHEAWCYKKQLYTLELKCGVI